MQTVGKIDTCMWIFLPSYLPALSHLFFATDLGRDPLVTGKQAVEIKHTLKEPRSLADQVQTTGHTKELHLRDACWRQANGEFKEHVLF